MHTHMDVSRFTTGKTSVLCENSMHIETQYLGLTPLVFNAHEVNDTFNANIHIYYSQRLLHSHRSDLLCRRRRLWCMRMRGDNYHRID